MNSYKMGNVVRLSTTFSLSGAVTDPTTVLLRVKNAAGYTIYTYGSSSIVKDSTGVYHLDITVSTPGSWYYRWEGTGTVIAAQENTFVVDATYFP